MTDDDRLAEYRPRETLWQARAEASEAERARLVAALTPLVEAAQEWHQAMHLDTFDGPRISKANDALAAAVVVLGEQANAPKTV